MRRVVLYVSVEKRMPGLAVVLVRYSGCAGGFSSSRTEPEVVRCKKKKIPRGPKPKSKAMTG